MSNLPKTDRPSLLILLVILICSILAGILGGIIAKNYIYPDYSSSSYSSDNLNLALLNTDNKGLIIHNPQKVIVNQDLKIAETINNIKPGLVGVFKYLGLKQSVSSSVAVVNKKTNAKYQTPYYNLEQPLFTGLVITSDGWVVALAPDNLKTNFEFKDYVVIVNNQKTYKIDSVNYSKKLPGNLLLFHLAQAANLPTKKIISRSDLFLGQSLLVVNGSHTIWPTALIPILNFSFPGNL
jgi:hypothetical protein